MHDIVNAVLDKRIGAGKAFGLARIRNFHNDQRADLAIGSVGGEDRTRLHDAFGEVRA